MGEVEEHPKDGAEDVTDYPDDELPAIKLCRNSGKDKLDLSNKNLQVMPNHIFNLVHVQYLYLEGNMIEEIPSKLCESLTHLVWFDIRRNSLKTLPTNISLLARLKNLLLEGNQIELLPLELGSLINLSGLNLRNNPLNFPPKNVLAKGTKEILKYLREYNRMQPVEFVDLEDSVLQESANLHDSHSQMLGDEGKEDKEVRKYLKTAGHEYPVGYYAGDISDDRRRSCLEENMLQLLRHSVNSLEIRERKNFARYSLPALRTKRLYLDPYKKVRQSKGGATEDESLPKLSYTISSKSQSHEREVNRSGVRRFNEKTDKVLQARKNKKMLDDWRKRNASKSNKYVSGPSDSKHEIVIPYGHDALPRTDNDLAITKSSKEAADSSTASESHMNRLALDEQLESRIKEHVRNIKQWRRQHSNSTLSIDEQLSATTKNLEKAQQLQQQLHEKRAREYRLRAFTGGEYAPPAHTSVEKL